MNLSKLKENRGARLRLMPPATRQRVGGTFEECDDIWTLEQVERERIRLANERTRQCVELAPATFLAGPATCVAAHELGAAADITMLNGRAVEWGYIRTGNAGGRASRLSGLR